MYPCDMILLRLSHQLLSPHAIQGQARDLPKLYEQQRREMQRLLAASDLAASSLVERGIAATSGDEQMETPTIGADTSHPLPAPRRLRPRATANAMRAARAA